MRLQSVWSSLLVCAALAVAACAESPVEHASVPLREVHQSVNSTDKVLILGSSVTGGLQSREAQAVAAQSPTTAIHVVTPEQWRAMTSEQFMSYRALILGDGACQSGTSAFQAAIDTRDTWGDIVDGDVAVLATDPSHNNTPLLVENALAFVLNSVQYRTGMYIALGCAYQEEAAPVAVTLLEPFGTFKVQGVPGCAESAHVFQMYPDLLSRDLFDGLLTGDGCAARSVFTQYPEQNFSLAAMALSTPEKTMPGQKTYSDVLVNPGEETAIASAPYVLLRGASPQGIGCGLSEAPDGEECDLGDYMNGQRALPGQSAEDTCSYSCRLHWCGDGVVDSDAGEECDLGVFNGRKGDASGGMGSCTASCQLPTAAPAPSHPPTALCGNVTVVAEYTCVEPAAIDSGSYDADDDLTGCTQSPAGPYGIGDTTVTLTCADQAGHTSSCTGIVTVVDAGAPTLTLNGPSSVTLACGAPYTDPGATANDTCAQDLTSSITVTSNLDRNRAGQYTTTFRVADPSGNVSTAIRNITVGPCSTCINLRLGEHNLFLEGDYNLGTDVEGKVAAGGNITMNHFSVGHRLPDTHLSNALVAGGNLKLTNGGVWGDARYGGTFSADTTVVYPRGTRAQGTPIDFTARWAELRTQSSQLAALPVNGTTRRENWGGIFMRGTHPSLNVFDVSASAFNGCVMWSIEAPAGSLVVVNIRGNPPTFRGFGISFSGGITSTGVLYNFVDATSVSAQGFGFMGTILAPSANFTFTDGVWEGGLYAKSLTGNAEGHINPLTHRDICP